MIDDYEEEIIDGRIHPIKEKLDIQTAINQLPYGLEEIVEAGLAELATSERCADDISVLDYDTIAALEYLLEHSNEAIEALKQTKDKK